MLPQKKIVQRLSDPVFYRKRSRDFIRCFKSFPDSPQPLLVRERPWKKASVVVAHPDDETFCSGLICELVAFRVEVEVLCVTKGEGGPCGGFDRAALGEVRAAEMAAACEILNVKNLQFLNHIDPISDYRVYAPDVSVSALAEQINATISDIDLIISHGSSGEYWHPAHLLVHDAVAMLKRTFRPKLPWMTFLARQLDHSLPRLVNWDDVANFVLDVSKYQETRELALACHQTQLSVFGRFAEGDFRDFIKKTSLESLSFIQ